MRHLTTLSVCSVCLLSSAVAVAQTKRDLDSHEHGSSTLNIIIDNDEMFLEFANPWMNLVGFEHKPSTDAQHTAIELATAELEAPLKLFVPNSEAACAVEATNVASTLSGEEGHEHDEDHDDHGDEHAEGEDHDHGEEHAEGEDHDHGEEHAEGEDHDHDEEHAEGEDHDHDEEHAEGEHSDNHSEVVASYTYRCESMDELKALDVQVFQIWLGIEDVDVQLAGPGGQSSLELGSGSSRVDLAPIR